MGVASQPKKDEKAVWAALAPPAANGLAMRRAGRPGRGKRTRLSRPSEITAVVVYDASRMVQLEAIARRKRLCGQTTFLRPPSSVLATARALAGLPDRGAGEAYHEEATIARLSVRKPGDGSSPVVGGERVIEAKRTRPREA